MLASMLSKDAVIESLDLALRTLSASTSSARPMPSAPTALGSKAFDGKAPSDAARWSHETPRLSPETPRLSPDERRLSGALMRVNHVGEVCAQALYAAQAMTARTPAQRQLMRAAARDETDHLAWCECRLQALGDRPSLLNPLWFAGAFALGLAAGRAGDARSLGFLAETEHQVEQHLLSHLQRLPAADVESRAVVAQMAQDEARHAEQATQAGAIPVPAAVRWLMRAAAAVMTRTAHVI